MDNGLLTAIVGAAGLVLGGGSVWTYFSRREDRQAQREESEIVRLRADVDRLRERDLKCQQQLEAVEQRLWAMEQAQTSHMARWTKDHRKRLTWVNAKAMLLIFGPLGYSVEDVLDRTFEQLLNSAAAKEIDRLDSSALANPGAAVSNLIQLHPMLPIMVVVKVAASGPDGNLVFEGCAYRVNDPELAAANGAARQIEAVEASVEHLFEATGERGSKR